jgi:hypothetical protein
MKPSPLITPKEKNKSILNPTSSSISKIKISN